MASTNASNFYNVISDNKTIELPPVIGTATNLGDICYWDSVNRVAKPISMLTTAATETLDQVQVAQNFVGIALDNTLSTETAPPNRLYLCDGICDMPLYNDTFHEGFLIGATWAGGAALVTQQVRNVSNLALAIGRLVREPASGATRVRARVLSRIALDLLHSTIPMNAQGVSVAGTLTDANQTLTPASPNILNMTPTAARNVTLPKEAQSQGLVFYFTNNSGGAFTVTFQTSAGGAIKGNGAVPQNKTGMFFYDTNTSSWCGLVSA